MHSLIMSILMALGAFVGFHAFYGLGGNSVALGAAGAFFGMVLGLVVMYVLFSPKRHS